MSEEQSKKEETTIVDEHRKMVMMTGNLSDFQLENLKKWPFIVFETGLEKANITYDFTKLVAEEESLSPGVVQYDFHFKEGTKLNRADVKKRLEHLKTWVKFMFWKETEVRIMKDGKKWQI